ncbi:phage head-tail connector protein [Salinicoccus roseus]|uniref:phage head-tail connector protein n=1 Tax=Salinicoccus roseus TaxID=45670 RepID=UPI0023013F74|nr:phage head-tail connector protein [Salinicoccus roseus]
MATLDDVKTLIGLSDTDTAQDKPLNLIISMTERRLKKFLPVDVEELPADLQDIVVEVTIIRYNRIGNEGMQSESVEGRSMTFSDDDFRPYREQLAAYRPKNRKGRVGFF